MIDPVTILERGVDIHTLFDPKDQEDCTKIYDSFISYLKENDVYFEHNRIFEKPVGPWPTPMWQLVLKGPNFFSDLGKAVAWLSLNRGGFSVMIHPNTSDELLDHTERTMWIGKSYKLKLEIFS